VLRRIKGVILSNMLWSFIITLLFSRLRLPALSSGPHSLLGSALGLLLVFRTNAR
jgi:predicted membrane chloride channel (bestrophin family)